MAGQGGSADHKCDFKCGPSFRVTSARHFGLSLFFIQYILHDLFFTYYI